MDAMEKLNDLVDESDPDAGFWNIITYKILYTLILLQLLLFSNFNKGPSCQSVGCLSI